MLRRLLLAGILSVSLVPVHAALINLPEEDEWAQVSPDLALSSGVEIQRTELKRVVSLMEAGRKEEARRRLAAVLDAHPEDPEALMVAGSILMSDGKFREAQVAFEASLKFGAGPAALSRLGVVRLLMGDLSRGGQILSEALRHSPDDKLALRYMAWLAERQGNIDAQQVFLERLVSHQPATTVTEAVSALAGLYLSLIHI